MEILDVTLREGEQRAGYSYTVDQKVEVTETLSSLGVACVQVGFPVADDRTRRVCERLDVDAKTAGIARVIDRDVDAAIESGVDVIELFAPTSDRQRERLLGITREELRSRIDSAVARAAETDRELHFTAMDGFRSDSEFLSSLFSAISDDVTYLSIADTVGARTPAGVRSFLNSLSSDLDRSRLGVHFHDDLGVATANALTAAEQGVGKIDVSVAGAGERAGNTPLEEFVVAGSIGKENVEPNIDVGRLIPATMSIVDVLAEEVSDGKPVLGRGAFEHESGLHTAAMLDDPATFEPFDPAVFGGERRLLFGAASGRGVAKRLLKRADREVTDERVDAMLGALADEKERTLDEAIELASSIE